ncbi:GNAT family N-acetyltransferase [Roseivivax sp. CAU 1753]
MPDGSSINADTASVFAIGDHAFSVSVVETYPAFRAMKFDWQALEAADPHCTVFLSWTWLNRVFRDNPEEWRVLVVRDAAQGDAPVCILPLRIKTSWVARRGEFRTAVEPAGRLIRSEYVGWLCHPDYDPDAIRITGAALKEMPWISFEMRYEATETRLRHFAEAFAGDSGFKVDFPEYRINKGVVDNLACPRVTLPESFETYLSALPSRNTRQKLRRLWRRHFKNGAWRVTFSDADTFQRDLDILIDHWTQKWAPVKGAAQATRVAANYRAILANAFKTDCLCLSVLWDGERPLAALGHVLDQDMDRVHFLVAGRDETVPDASVGMLLHAASIQWAIEHGFQCYDFCHGDEEYKFRFGAEVTQVGYLTIQRRGRGQTGYFDPLCLRPALRQVARFARKGRVDEAEAGATCLATLPI